MKLFVGQTRLTGPVHRFSQRFDMVELRVEPSRLPRLAKLRAWRDEAREAFVFALVLPAETYEAAGVDEILEYAGRAADALRPGWWVLRTPARLTPAPSMVRRLAALVARVPAGPRLAWEPSGPWDVDRSRAVAKDLGLHLVRDGSRDALPPGDVVYTRLRALGEGANVSVSAAERLAEQLHGRSEAYVVVEGVGAGRVRSVLASELEGELGDDGALGAGDDGAAEDPG